jgi:hypothetical protein
MNHAAASALIQAQLNGVRQIKWRTRDGEGGRCATAVLNEAGLMEPLTKRKIEACPECGATSTETAGALTGYRIPIRIVDEATLVVHLNNDHGWDFIKIARCLEDPEAA